MSQGSLEIRQQHLSPEARRQLLLVACTLDRVALLARSRNRDAQPRVLAAIEAAAPWLQTVTSVALRLLPAKLRLASSLLQLWRRR